MDLSLLTTGEFDMRVKSCAASDGGGHIIQLSDEHGCVLRPKMISRFLKAKISDERASVITYAFFHAFKFPDALSVHIKCKVEICRHGCLDHCQLADSLEPHGHLPGLHGAFNDFNTLERKDSSVPNSKESTSDSQPQASTGIGNDLLYDDKPIDDVPNETNFDEQNPAQLRGKPAPPPTPKSDPSTTPSPALTKNEHDVHPPISQSILPAPRENTQHPLNMQPVSKILHLFVDLQAICSLHFYM